MKNLGDSDVREFKNKSDASEDAVVGHVEIYRGKLLERWCTFFLDEMKDFIFFSTVQDHLLGFDHFGYLFS